MTRHTDLFERGRIMGMIKGGNLYTWLSENLVETKSLFACGGHITRNKVDATDNRVLLVPRSLVTWENDRYLRRLVQNRFYE